MARLDRKPAEGHRFVPVIPGSRGTLATCEAREGPMGIVSYYQEVVSFSGNTGTGLARFDLTDVPDMVGEDCYFIDEIIYTRQ